MDLHAQVHLIINHAQQGGMAKPFLPVGLISLLLHFSLYR